MFKLLWNKYLFNPNYIFNLNVSSLTEIIRMLIYDLNYVIEKLDSLNKAKIYILVSWKLAI